MNRDSLLGLHSDYSLTGVVVDLPPSGVGLNQMEENLAMGLAEERAIAPPPADGPLYRKLGGLEPQALCRIAEDPSADFFERLAAGRLLNLMGDPRIDARRPAMLELPAGRYELGLAAEELDGVVEEFGAYGVLREWIEKEVPRHPVDLAGVRIAKYPVTHGEYRTFVAESGWRALPSTWSFGVMPEHLCNHPVCTIKPQDADAYARWLAQISGRKFRLPSEAEWEAAAGGPDGLTYPWGNDYLRDRANTLESGILATTPVGVFSAGASPIGCLDMAGNVEEYVADDYRPYPGGRQVDDDLKTNESGYRVARGGSFTRYRDLARCKRRHGWYKSPIYMMGFRLAEDVQ